MTHKISPRMYIPYFILYNKFYNLEPKAAEIIKKYELYFGHKDITRSLWHRLMHRRDLKRIQVLLRKTEWKEHFYPIYNNGCIAEYGIIASQEELFKIIVCNSDYANLYDRVASHSLFNSIADFINRNENEILMTSVHQFTRRYSASVSEERNFTINSKGKMTYLPAGKLTEVTDNETWATKDRTEIAYGRGLRKIFSYSGCIPSDAYIEQLSNYLRAQYEFSGVFEFVDKEDIKYWYHHSRYADNTGTLENSCMKKDSCQEYLNLYAQNPLKVCLLIAKKADDPTKIIGRALIWKTECGNTLMDRVYGTDQTIAAFLEKAREHSWYAKRYQNHHAPHESLDPNGNVVNKTFTVKLDTSNLDYLPYMDTFKYSDDIEAGYLNNQQGDYVLENIDGSWPDDDEWVTTICGTRVRQDDARWSDYHDNWYLEDDVVWSEYHSSYIEYDEAVRVGDEYYMPDADCLHYSEYEDEHIHIEDALYSETMNDYIYDHRAVQLIDGEYVDQDAIETRELLFDRIAADLNETVENIKQATFAVCEDLSLRIRCSDNRLSVIYECWKDDSLLTDNIHLYIVKQIKEQISIMA